MSHPTIPQVDCSRGAPRGRPNVWPNQRPVKYNIRRIHGTDGGDYDLGGAYWGDLNGKPLFCAWSREPDPGGFYLFLRAAGYADASEKIKQALNTRYGEPK